MSNGHHQALFQPDLLKDEKIMWSGQPEPGVNFTKGDIFLVPFGLFFAGFSLMLFRTVIFSVPLNPDKSAGVIIFFYLIGFVFTVFGLYFAFGRFLYKRWKKRKIYYALTDQRALVLTLAFGRRVDGAFLDHLASLNKTVRSSGIGTIYFGNPSWVSSVYGNSGMDFFMGFYAGDVPTFYDIRDVDSVYDLANRLR